MKKFFYRVNQGESVAALASRFNVPVSTIVKSNNLSAEIEEGDVLFIERLSGALYSAKPFDTMEDVAERFHVTVEELKAANGVDYLFYGLNVIIPD